MGASPSHAHAWSLAGAPHWVWEVLGAVRLAKGDARVCSRSIIAQQLRVLPAQRGGGGIPGGGGMPGGGRIPGGGGIPGGMPGGIPGGGGMPGGIPGGGGMPGGGGIPR
eukprot:CAMPEP_0118927598 /NCGR_PEP_ID=MMETSP1169-20130426/5038_1 /TAXON_ID=36882 /ORGANISM="Pyramimonas obovata, Strain CCMP722" /LENGTH=108 /DNA_ID=CAMNT_0006869393 /DNA_START=324 /DNA_END=647 /DNA_ORIENTATION=-